MHNSELRRLRNALAERGYEFSPDELSDALGADDDPTGYWWWRPVAIALIVMWVVMVAVT